MEHVAADLPVVWSDVAISVIVADIVPAAHFLLSRAFRRLYAAVVRKTKKDA